MQRLYSMFPPGGPGVGLVLLRLAVAVSLTTDAVAPPLSWLAAATALFAGAGLATPIAAVTAAALHLLGALPAAAFDPTLLLRVLTAAALTLLGPGAYSIDARRFGRRRVVTTPPAEE